MTFARLAGALCLLLFAEAALAQSAYLPAGRNATVIEASYFRIDGFDGYGAGIGYDMLGAMAFGFRYDKISRIGLQDIAWDDFDESTIAPFASVLAFRPAPGFPVGAEATVAYTFSQFDGEHVDAIDQEARGSALNLGLELLARWEPFDGLRLWPRVSGDWYAWSIDGQVAALDVDRNEEIDEIEIFDVDDLSQYAWSAGVGIQIAEKLVLSIDRVEYELQDPVYRLAFVALYIQEDDWWN